MPCLPRCILAALALLAGGVGRAAAYEPRPIYVKLDLDQALRAATDTDQDLKQAAQEIIQAIRDPLYYRFFSWRLEAKEPSDTQSFPELRIIVREDLSVDNWSMHVLLKTGNKPEDYAWEFPERPVLLLDSQDLPTGNDNVPVEGPKRIQRVREWFIQHFVRPKDTGPLYEHLRENMPLARAHFNPDPLRALPLKQAVIYLPFDDYRHLRASEFRLVCLVGVGDVVREPFRGKGHHTVPRDKQLFKALLIEYEGTEDVNGLTEGDVFLKKYHHPPLMTGPLIHQ